MQEAIDYHRSSSQPPIDLNFLNEITDGEPDEEALFVAIFTQVSTETLNVLILSSQQNNEETWSAASHKLKSAAGNIGATMLWTICDHAEHNYPENIKDKQNILDCIQNEYQTVHAFFKERGTA